jgi:predicted flap endonuclease-1-like 5' DNA nuclease
MNDFFNLLGDFFQNRPLTNEEQILLLILGVLILTIGIIIGWIIQGLTTRRYKKELLLLRKDRDEFEARYRAGETKQKALAKELEAMSREKVEALDRIQGMQNDLSARDAQVTQLQQSNEALAATNQSYTGTIESLNEQVTELRTQNEQLLERADAVVVPIEDNMGAGAGAGNGQGSNESLNAYIATSEARFRELELRLREMNQENRELLTSRGTLAPANPYTGHQPVMTPELSDSTEPLVIRADTTEPGARTGSQGSTKVIVKTTPSIHIPTISSAEAPEADDLTLIDNIGPFLQSKLNEADIYSYEQIANWTEADIVTYTNLIGYIPGIIQRDDWVGQARGLAMSEAAHQPGDDGEMAFASSAAPTPMESGAENTEDTEDDLRVVEGIGPKIESILKASGIMTLGALADTSTERLREILDEAGSRFKSHDPKTWAVQAGLAADGKLTELKAWQKELKGGK